MRKLLTACGLLVMTFLPELAQTNEPGTGGGMMGMAPGVIKARADVQTAFAPGNMTAMQSGSAIDADAHYPVQARFDALKALEPAAETLCQALTPEQTKKADTLLGVSGMM